jgi:hypothetical protein
VITVKSIQRLIELRQEVNTGRVETPRLASAYHDELLITGAQFGTRPELLIIALDELVTEVAEARDAMLAAQAERRGLTKAGPYRA